MNEAAKYRRKNISMPSLANISGAKGDGVNNMAAGGENGIRRGRKWPWRRQAMA